MVPYRECVRLEKCGLRGYFVHKATRRCITAEACLALSPRHYAYTTITECVALEPDMGAGGGLVENDGGRTYVCRNSDYCVDLSGSKTMCVSSYDCRKTKHPFREYGVLECMTAVKCAAEGYFVAVRYHNCFTQGKCRGE